MPNGVIVYRGPSMIDGSPIVAIATGLEDLSNNPKTGGMLQLFILSAIADPVKVAKRGQDASVCGNCQHRPANDNTCYVALFQGPLSVYRAFRRGNYLDHGLEYATHEIARAGKPVRLGAYGDPAALPVDVVAAICSVAPGHTGYTHQWRSFPQLRPYVVASVDSPDQLIDAHAAGWRTFRTGTAADVTVAGIREIACPASDESGNRTTCAKCRLCDGSAHQGVRASVKINPHGPRAIAFYRKPVAA